MAIVPKAVFFNGWRGMANMLLTAPVFFLIFAVAIALVLVPLTSNIVKCVVLCQRFKIGSHLFNPLLALVECLFTILLARNILCPSGVLANCGKWLHFIMAPLLLGIGALFDRLRLRQGRSQGLSGDVPAVDGKCEVIRVDERVTVVNAQFSESLDSVCTMSVIKHEDFVVFWNPVFAPAELYRELAGCQRRAIVFVNTMYHHMATQIALAALPGAEVWGCGSVEGRHPKPLGIRDPVADGLSLNGVTFFHLPGTLYDEWWMYFAPSKFMGLGDFCPHMEDDLLQGPSLAMTRTAHCCDACSMMAYSRSLVVDHAGTAALVKRILALDIDRLEGAHPPGDSSLASGGRGGRPDPREALERYWSWLLPSRGGLGERLV
uniref:Uncharacterized protein n=1 Tax=Zooxanthella nutricula TaxID=1333877 RepID=A0A6U6PXF8_9DINO|eukprot:CAMPEP_0198504646 /NCGR_PEP_ID=MMETSP1462-20131121/10604_1 /TAXON_ID=1333877 /ORGANISM="Brandtodinium nutriculum, Strain RCC3387" /LENGTH=376 /DNA_ID=CAMNT_0044233819 /DNA_START=49 /DNA_END=1179 /DNA_ORIENTATION=+